MEIVIVSALLVCVIWISVDVASKNNISTSLIGCLFVEHLIATLFYQRSFQGDWVYYFEEGRRLAATHAQLRVGLSRGSFHCRD